MKPVGQPIPHESARAHVTGFAKYTGDIQQLAGTLEAWPVQAPHAKARVVSLDARPALEVAGVVAVLTAADVTGENDTGAIRHDEPLFPSEIEHHGQAVCWVLAENLEAARDGAKAVQVEYTTLEPILTMQDAIAAKSYHVDALRFRRGEAQTQLANSEHVLEGEFEIGGQDHFYLETHASLAHIDEDGHLFVHASTQHPSETQAIVARVLGISRNAVTVQCLRMGGGFGGKETQANPYAAIAALGAAKTKRPVRVRLSRHLDMQLTGKRHPMLARYKVGFSSAGRLEALEVELYSDGGWTLDLSEAVLLRACVHVDNAYFIAHMDVTGRVCKTNKTSQTAFRGFGGPQGVLVIEEIVDRVARTLKLPAETVRANNFYGRGDERLETTSTHYAQPIKDWQRMPAIWTELLHTSDHATRTLERDAFNAAHPYKRRGLAITPVKFGISFNTIFLNQAGALVHIYEDGSVQVNHGGTEMGQGLHTKIQQIAAQSLGVPLEQVRITPTRTDKVPNTSATAASTGADLNGAAVKNACDTLRARLAEVAAGLFAEKALGHPHPEDLEFSGGHIWVKGKPEQRIGFAHVVDVAYHARVSLSSTGFYRTPDIHFDKLAGKGEPFRYFAFGAAVSEVTVDGLTGNWHLERVDILHDCGDSLNPLVDQGQVEGGFVQGMGWLTMEELVWDDTGRLRTHAPSTYKIPTLADVPEDFRVQLLPRAFESGAVFGGKAVGEPPLMLGISVREAIKDAISAFGDGGVVDLASPATPEAILWAVEAVKVRAQRQAEAVSAD